MWSPAAPACLDAGQPGPPIEGLGGGGDGEGMEGMERSTRGKVQDDNIPFLLLQTASTFNPFTAFQTRPPQADAGLEGPCTPAPHPTASPAPLGAETSCPRTRPGRSGRAGSQLRKPGCVGGKHVFE